MKRRVGLVALVLLAAALAPETSRAQATSSAFPVRDVHVGQVQQLYLNDTEQEKWYLYNVGTDRSFCAEVGSDEVANQSSDPVLDVYRDDGTTLIGHNDNAFNGGGGRPHSSRGARVCFISPTVDVFVKVTDLVGGTNVYRLRVVETTLWGSWYFISGDYNSFVLLRNTAGEGVNFTVRWRNTAGTIVGNYGGSVGANAVVVLNARTYITSLAAANLSGSVEVVHTGSPQALVGQVTTLSGTTGLNFDSAFYQRQAAW